MNGLHVECEAATEDAFDELGIRLVAVEVDNNQTRVVGWAPTGKKVKVKVQPRGTEASKVFVRVGVFGSQQLHHEVHQQLMAELDARPQGENIAALEE